jgi:hypothetical protein
MAKKGKAAVAMESVGLVTDEAKEKFDVASRRYPVLMRGIALALRQGRGLGWLKKEDLNNLFQLEILDLDEKGREIMVREEMRQLFCPRRNAGETPPVSGVYLSSGKSANEPVLEYQIMCSADQTPPDDDIVVNQAIGILYN